jgi:phosphatidylcholine synthase
VAFAVHIFTALGAACALFALVAAARGDWTLMFAWLGGALLIDGIDGTLARRAKVAERLPRWSGDTLDFVVDFTTYVFVPAYAIAAAGLLPAVAAVPAAAAIVVSGAIYFADRDMKISDNYFRGFPALWNAAAFHLFIVKASPWVAVLIVLVLVLMTFAPLRFVHPFRVANYRALTVAVLALWSALALYALSRSLDPGPAAAWVLTACGLYFFLIGFLPARK